MNQTRTEWIHSLRVGDRVLDSKGRPQEIAGVRVITAPYLPLSLGRIVSYHLLPKIIARKILEGVEWVSRQLNLYEVIDSTLYFSSGDKSLASDIIWIHPSLIDGLSVRQNLYSNWIIQHKDYPTLTLVTSSLKEGVERLDHHIRRL